MGPRALRGDGQPGYPLLMRGAVAAGHPLTARAGARVLEAGGNAVDAAVAAALASWVAESPLTGPGAGGFMLAHRAGDHTTRVFDFFVAVPGLGLAAPVPAEMDRVEIDFSGGSTQAFHDRGRILRSSRRGPRARARAPVARNTAVE